MYPSIFNQASTPKHTTKQTIPGAPSKNYNVENKENDNPQVQAMSRLAQQSTKNTPSMSAAQTNTPIMQNTRNVENKAPEKKQLPGPFPNIKRTHLAI